MPLFRAYLARNFKRDTKLRASGFRATSLMIMNEDGVPNSPNWHVPDIYFFPKHPVPAPCQRANVEVKACGCEGSEFLHLHREKFGDVPTANWWPITQDICQEWKNPAETASQCPDIIALAPGCKKFPHFKANSDLSCSNHGGQFIFLKDSSQLAGEAQLKVKGCPERSSQLWGPPSHPHHLELDQLPSCSFHLGRSFLLSLNWNPWCCCTEMAVKSLSILCFLNLKSFKSQSSQRVLLGLEFPDVIVI